MGSLPRYDLDDAEMVAICTAALSSRRSGRFHCVQTGPDTALAQVARTVECRVFDQEFGNDASQMADEYRLYERRSEFFVVLDVRRRRPAGVMRVVDAPDPSDRLKSVVDLESAVGFTAEQYLAHIGLPDFTSAIDVETMVIVPEYRGSTSGSYRVGQLFYRALLLHTTARAGYLLMIMDRRARRSLEYIGLPLIDVLGEPFAYLGSPASHALCMTGPDIEEWIRRRRAASTVPAAVAALRGRPVRRWATDLALACFVRGITRGTGTDRYITAGG